MHVKSLVPPRLPGMRIDSKLYFPGARRLAPFAFNTPDWLAARTVDCRSISLPLDLAASARTDQVAGMGAVVWLVADRYAVWQLAGECCACRELSTFDGLHTRMPPEAVVERRNRIMRIRGSNMYGWLRIACAFGVFVSYSAAQIGLGQDDGSMFTANRRDGNTSTEPRRPRTEDEMVIERRRALMQEFDAETSLDRGQSIHPDLMSSVKDNTIGVRYEEREAYLRVLRLASEVPLHRQEQFAADLREERRTINPVYNRRKPGDFPPFVDLFTHPEPYRGRPVTLRGTLRKLTAFDVGKNRFDLERVYEGWVYTDDSQGNPAVVVFTSKDDRLPIRGDLQEEVRFTGYYFKMYGYDAQDVARKAPLIIAGEIEWIPHPYKNVYQAMGIEWYGLTTLVFLIGCYLFWQTNRKEMPPRPPLQIEPDFTHFPPREHPATDRHLPQTMTETEDS